MLPPSDDHRLWDVWLSSYQMPALVIADELGLFARLDATPSTEAEVAAALDLSPRAAEALLAVVAALGFLAQHEGRFYVTQGARPFLLPESPFYWGGILHANRQAEQARALRKALRREVGGLVTSQWERQEVDPERSRAFLRAMHSHAQAAAAGLAQSGALRDARRILDVGGGSGAYTIALAQRDPALRCTVMELPAIVPITEEFVAAAGLSGQVAVHGADMFHDPWPPGHDAVLFSDVFHNWDAERCLALARRSYEALPPGGALHLHEMLLADTRDGPLHAALYSLLMLLFGEGKQFTAGELFALLRAGGFERVSLVPGYGYHSLVSGWKGAA